MRAAPILTFRDDLVAFRGRSGFAPSLESCGDPGILSAVASSVCLFGERFALDLVVHVLIFWGRACRIIM
jgi:hypothetical protein